MIPSIIERLVIQGDAQIIQQTIGLNGANTIEVPTGKTVIVLGVNLQPLLSLTDLTKNWNAATFGDWKEYVKDALVQTLDPDGLPTDTNLNILELLLNRGLTQIELYSIDNRTVFTYSNEYEPVPILSAGGAPLLVAYLPNIKEHKEECYSVHKKQIHVRLRFANSFLIDDGFQALTASYKTAVDNGNLFNTVPEQTNKVFDLYKEYIFQSAAVFQTSFSGSTKYGIFPFANETNLNGSYGLGTYVNNKFVLLPYDNKPTTQPNGTNGELGFFSNSPYSGGVTTLAAYQQLFTPYINIQYALINEQPQSLAIVSPDKYQTVISK